MNRIIILFGLLFSLATHAQKELWATTATGNWQFEGNIVKYDMNGENAITMHVFNYPDGKRANGKLLLASNGKLYGTTTYGGINATTPDAGSEDGYGVIYEYDLIFDTYRVVHYFNNSASVNTAGNPTSALIEPIPGKLYGGTYWGGFFVYDIDTETVSTLNHTYSFVAMGSIYSDLIKASNGFLYAVSNQSFPCTSPGSNQPNQGSIIKINTTTNTSQRIATFNCDGSNGIGGGGYSEGSNLVEALPNRIFFTSQGSPIFFEDGSITLAGNIVEFNTLTNTLTVRVPFNLTEESIGRLPRSLVLNENGNLYGVCQVGGDTYRANSPQTSSNKTGTIFEYNPTTNVLIKLRDIVPERFSPYNLIKLSTGDYMGNFYNYGLFKYKVDTNSLELPDLLTYTQPDQTSTLNLIEICRKPTYHFFDVDTFDTCVGSTFSYDIQNTNASSYQWTKDGGDVPSQTSGILNLINMTATDAGNYTCLMTNECGTTTTMPLHVTVSCLGTDTFSQLDKSIKLHPNPASTLLNIELPQNIDISISSCTISNMLGQTVYQSATAEKIDVSQFQDGIYIVVLQTNYGNWNGKFVKNNK